MTKHRLSSTPDPLPPPKRQHTLISLPPSHAHATSLATLYDEIILVIFSFLSYADLCAIQRTNRNWSRLALDNQLWKRLYLGEYGRTRLRGVRGFIGRGDGKEVKPLPGRAKVEETEDLRDWKWMFRISCNWRTGRCSTDSVLPRSFLPTPSSASVDGEQEPHHRRILLAGSLIVATAQDRTHGPALSLVAASGDKYTLSCRTSRSTSSTEATALALDQSPPTSSHHARLAAFLSTGEYIVFLINHRHPSESSRVFTYQPTVRLPRTAPIVHAAYHGRILLTLSQSFHLSLYDLAGDKVVHTQTLSSFTSYPPSSMVLTPTSSTTYKLIVAYAIPVFPAHWSVGATELMISSDGPMTVTSSRTTRAMDVPTGWIDEQKMRAMREQWSRKVVHVADTQTDGKWVVLAPSEAPVPTGPAESADAAASKSSPSPYTSSSLHAPSSLQLYRLYFPASASGGSTGTPKLSFVRTLHGQLGAVCAVSLADGRCVSLGVNGRIWVWDLEAGTGTEVSGARAMSDPLVLHNAKEAVKGMVVFDERRIISADARGVVLRRFDV